MDTKYDGLVAEIVSDKKFETPDFLQQQNKPLASEDDITEVVRAYAIRLGGDKRRKKYEVKKESMLEAVLTRRGVMKLCDCKIEVRMSMEKIRKEIRKHEEMTPVHGEYAVPEHPWGLIKKLQAWGDCAEDNPKYYLHMVYRYQIRLLHKACSEGGLVLEHPSLQSIVDILHPSTCSSKFPPEFKRFMHECAEVRVNVVSLPVPKRDNAKEVDYTTNFEATPAVAALRRKLQKTIVRWRCCDVYPEYLLKDRPGNDAITEAVELAARVRERKKRSEYLEGDDLKTIQKVLEAVPQMSDVNAKYMSCTHKTQGERLNERLGFFLRPSVRSIFVASRDKGLVEEVFDLTDRSYDHFRSFDLYCTADSPLPFLDTGVDGEECRRLLLMLENLVSLFGLDDEVGSEAVEPHDIVRDAILRLRK